MELRSGMSRVDISNAFLTGSNVSAVSSHLAMLLEIAMCACVCVCVVAMPVLFTSIYFQRTGM